MRLRGRQHPQGIAHQAQAHARASGQCEATPQSKLERRRRSQAQLRRPPQAGCREEQGEGVSAWLGWVRPEELLFRGKICAETQRPRGSRSIPQDVDSPAKPKTREGAPDSPQALSPHQQLCFSFAPLVSA